MWFLDKSPADDGAILQHIVQIHQVAVVHVLGKIVRVMEVDDPLLMSLDHFLGKQKAVGDVLADRPRHVISLYAVDHWILI